MREFKVRSDLERLLFITTRIIAVDNNEYRFHQLEQP